MAVQIVCYEIRMVELEGTLPPRRSHWENPFATSKDMEYFYEHLEETLVELGFLIIGATVNDDFVGYTAACVSTTWKSKYCAVS